MSVYRGEVTHMLQGPSQLTQNKKDKRTSKGLRASDLSSSAAALRRATFWPVPSGSASVIHTRALLGHLCTEGIQSRTTPVPPGRKQSAFPDYNHLKQKTKYNKEGRPASLLATPLYGPQCPPTS